MIFAGLSGDYNVLHTDAEHMKASLFGERIAHGLLGLSIQQGLLDRVRARAGGRPARRGEVEVQGADQDRRHDPRAGQGLRQEGRRPARRGAWSRSSAGWSTSAARSCRRARPSTWSPAGPAEAGRRDARSGRAATLLRGRADGRAARDAGHDAHRDARRPLRLAEPGPAGRPGHDARAAAALPVLRARLARAPAAAGGARVHGLRVAVPEARPGWATRSAASPRRSRSAR